MKIMSSHGELIDEMDMLHDEFLRHTDIGLDVLNHRERHDYARIRNRLVNVQRGNVRNPVKAAYFRNRAEWYVRFYKRKVVWIIRVAPNRPKVYTKKPTV